VFQILSQLLEFRNDVSPPYTAIFPALLSPALWDNHGNVPAIIRLLTAYFCKGASSAMTVEQLDGVMGVFQKLNASKKLDHHGFALLMAVVEFLPYDKLSKYLITMLRLIFSRLSPTSRTTKYTKSLLVFLSFFVHKHGLGNLLGNMDQVQPGVFAMILEKVWIPGMSSCISVADRRAVVVGVTKMVLESPEFLQDNYLQFWVPLVSGMVQMIEAPSVQVVEETEVDLSDKAFSTSFVKLSFAPPPARDAFAQVANPQKAFVEALQQKSNQPPFNTCLGNLPEKVKNALGKWSQ